ncbi:MAG: GerAB/ArcD/ProY family transporter [bacterium]|nr:GerAB/ArcD/ProY family transporter [bacterium]
MYSENKKITLRQLKRLLVFDLFGVVSLVVPYIITTDTGYDGIPALLFGAVLVIVYLLILLFFMKNIKGSYLEFSTKTIGRVLTFIVCILYIFKFFTSIAMVTRIFTEVIRDALLPGYTTLTIAIPMLIAAGYLGVKGAEVRARFSEVLYFIVLVPIFLLLLLGLKDVDLANVTPIFTAAPINSIYGGFSFFLIFNALELLLFIKHYIAPDHKERSTISSIFSYSLQGLIIVFVFSLLYYVLTVGLVGDNAAASKIWSSVMILQLIKIPWTLLNRQDSLILGLWLISIFSILSAFLYYICTMMKRMFRIDNKLYLMPLIVVIAIIASVIPMDVEQYYEYYMRYITWIGLPQSFIIPIIILLVDRIRGAVKPKPGSSQEEHPKAMKERAVKAAKKLSIFGALVVVLMSMTSCSKAVEIQDREFVQALGVDYVNNELTAYYILPDLAAISDQGSTDSDKLLRTFSGTDFYTIEEQYKLSAPKKLDYSHLKAIIVGKGLLENATVYKQFINYVENNYEISKNTYVFLVEGDVKQIIDFNKNVENGIGDYLDRLYKNNLASSEKEEISLGSLINEKNNTDEAMQIPLLTIQNKTLVIDGIGLVEDSHLRDVITGDDVVTTDLLSGYGENSRIFIHNGSKYDDYVIRLNELHNNKSITVQNGKPMYNYYLQATGTVEKGMEEYASKSTEEKEKIYNEIHQIVDKLLKDKMTAQLTEVVTRKEIDYLNIFRLSRYKNAELYKFYKDNQLGFIKALQFNVHVDIRFY